MRLLVAPVGIYCQWQYLVLSRSCTSKPEPEIREKFDRKFRKWAVYKLSRYVHTHVVHVPTVHTVCLCIAFVEPPGWGGEHSAR